MPEGLRPPHSTVYINSMKRGFSPQAAGASSNFSYLRLPKMTQKKRALPQQRWSSLQLQKA